MRFRFCGDDQCPRWVLAEIETISLLKPESLVLLAREILKICWGESLDYGEMLRVMEEDAEETADLKGAAAALHFILTCAAKHDVDEVSLTQEIQQLGLPQENASIIGAEYRDCKVALQQRLASDSYRLSRVLDTNWRVDVLVPPEATASSDVSIHLRLLVDNQPQSELVADYTDAVSARVSGNQNSVDDLTFSLSETQLDLLILELTQAKQILDQMKV